MSDKPDSKLVRFQLNGEWRSVEVEPHLLLVDFLRDHFHLKEPEGGVTCKFAAPAPFW